MLRRVPRSEVLDRGGVGGLKCWDAGEVGEGKGAACGVSEGKGPTVRLGRQGGGVVGCGGVSEELCVCVCVSWFWG